VVIVANKNAYIMHFNWQVSNRYWSSIITHNI